MAKEIVEKVNSGDVPKAYNWLKGAANRVIARIIQEID